VFARLGKSPCRHKHSSALPFFETSTLSVFLADVVASASPAPTALASAAAASAAAANFQTVAAAAAVASAACASRLGVLSRHVGVLGLSDGICSPK